MKFKNIFSVIFTHPETCKVKTTEFKNIREAITYRDTLADNYGLSSTRLISHCSIIVKKINC